MNRNLMLLEDLGAIVRDVEGRLYALSEHATARDLGGLAVSELVLKADTCPAALVEGLETRIAARRGRPVLPVSSALRDRCPDGWLSWLPPGARVPTLACFAQDAVDVWMDQGSDQMKRELLDLAEGQAYDAKWAPEELTGRRSVGPFLVKYQASAAEVLLLIELDSSGEGGVTSILHILSLLDHAGYQLARLGLWQSTVRWAFRTTGKTWTGAQQALAAVLDPHGATVQVVDRRRVNSIFSWGWASQPTRARKCPEKRPETTQRVHPLGTRLSIP